MNEQKIEESIAYYKWLEARIREEEIRLQSERWKIRAKRKALQYQIRLSTRVNIERNVL